jgi:AraC-like DNA-binding protein
MSRRVTRADGDLGPGTKPLSTFAHRSADPHLAALIERQRSLSESACPRAYCSRRRCPARSSTHSPRTRHGLEAIASKLHLSPRTAQPRLRDEGTSHQRVLGELRRDLALRYLDDAGVRYPKVRVPSNSCFDSQRIYPRLHPEHRSPRERADVARHPSGHGDRFAELSRTRPSDDWHGRCVTWQRGGPWPWIGSRWTR